jgi:uncharacterized protein (TIGR03546 family)
MITRKLGTLLRGKATPFQIVAACVLGAMLGFAPEVRQAPGLYALLVGALLVINANLGLALLVAGLTKLLSWIAAPVSFEVGQFLLDGPATGLARAVVNAPIFAWCGLSYYAVAGGQALGFVVGLVVGLLLARSVRAFQRRMAASANNPSKLNELAGKGWAKALTWVFFGGRAKGTWDDILAKKVGNPIRVVGVVIVAVLGAGLWLGHGYITRTWAHDNLALRLEQVNGATADVGAVTLDFGDGRFGLESLALADPEALSKDLFRADQLAADFDQVDILKRRVHMAQLVISGAKSGSPRTMPGTLKPTLPTDPAPGGPQPGEDDGLWSLDEVLAEAELWKGRLEQAKRVLEKVAGDKPVPGEDESYSERAARKAREAGWFNVEAGHLVDEAPTFTLSELVVDGLVADWLPGRLLDVRGSNLSTQPWLLDGAPKVTISSRDGAVGFDVDLAPASKAGGKGGLRMHWKGLAVDDALGMLKLTDKAPMSGGTLDLELDGGWANGAIGVLDLPLRATFRGTTFAVPGMQPSTVDAFTLPIGLSGPLDALVVKFDTGALTKALSDAGKAELANRLQSEFDKHLGGVLGDQLDGLKEKTGLEMPKELGGDAAKEIEKGAKDVLKGMLGGKKPPK